MPKIAAILLTTLSLCLGACASFDPYDGMAFNDFNHSAGLAGKGGAQLIGSNGNTEVYYLNGATDHNVFYWFDDGTLRKVTSGSLAQTKVALKKMYKAEHLKRAPHHVGATTAVAGGG
ncbi:MAG TPA: hypothetical protein VFB36_05095 [Nevskiaceae bacterium]|nr:hypothetical protein [Nevskiaceae bacterium]